MKINLKNFNLEEFFGCVQATNTKELKANVLKGLRTWLQEKSFAKWSNGQLQYVGDYMDGVDFMSTEEVSIEMKGALGLFNKNGSCKRLVLINKRPGKNKKPQLKKEDLQKTFEYMFLVDTKNMSIGYTDWETVYSRTECDGAGATFKLEDGDYRMLAKNVTPASKSITAEKLLETLDQIL